MRYTSFVLKTCNVNNKQRKRKIIYVEFSRYFFSKSDNDEDYITRPSKNASRNKSRKCMRSNVLFKEDLNESLHDLHKKVRDISFEQEKMSDKLNCEKRYCYSENTSKKCDELDSDVSFQIFSFETRFLIETKTSS